VLGRAFALGKEVADAMAAADVLGQAKGARVTGAPPHATPTNERANSRARFIAAKYGKGDASREALQGTTEDIGSPATAACCL